MAFAEPLHSHFLGDLPEDGLTEERLAQFQNAMAPLMAILMKEDGATIDGIVKRLCEEVLPEYDEMFSQHLAEERSPAELEAEDLHSQPGDLDGPDEP